MVSNEAARAAAFAEQADRSRALAAGYVTQMQAMARRVQDLKNLAETALNSITLPTRWAGTYLEILSPEGEWVRGPNLLGPGDVLGPSSSAEGNLVVFLGNTGKQVADSGATLADLLAAIEATEAANTAIQPGDSVEALVEGDTKKLLTVAERVKIGHLTVTQAVDLDAIEARVNALDAAVVLKGEWDASSGAFPGDGSAQAGESWIVSVAGTVDGVAFAVDDRLIAIADDAATGTYAANWHKADYSDLVQAVAGLTGTITAEALKTALAISNADISGLGTAATVDTGTDEGEIPLLGPGGKLDVGLLPEFGSIPTVAKSGAYTALAADKGRLIECTGTWTLALTAAATLADGWYVYIRNAGSGRITIDPDGAETVDGRASIYVYPGEAFLLRCNGTVFHTVARPQRVILHDHTISSTAVYDFEMGLDDREFASYDLSFNSLSHADTGTSRQIVMRFKESGAYVDVASSYNDGTNRTFFALTSLGIAHSVAISAGLTLKGAEAAAETYVYGISNNLSYIGRRTAAGGLEGIRLMDAGGGGLDAGRVVIVGVRA